MGRLVRQEKHSIRGHDASRHSNRCCHGARLSGLDRIPRRLLPALLFLCSKYTHSLAESESPVSAILTLLDSMLAAHECNRLQQQSLEGRFPVQREFPNLVPRPCSSTISDFCASLDTCTDLEQDPTFNASIAREARRYRIPVHDACWPGAVDDTNSVSRRSLWKPTSLPIDVQAGSSLSRRHLSSGWLAEPEKI